MAYISIDELLEMSHEARSKQMSELAAGRTYATPYTEFLDTLSVGVAARFPMGNTGTESIASARQSVLNAAKRKNIKVITRTVDGALWVGRIPTEDEATETEDENLFS